MLLYLPIQTTLQTLLWGMKTEAQNSEVTYTSQSEGHLLWACIVPELTAVPRMCNRQKALLCGWAPCLSGRESRSLTAHESKYDLPLLRQAEDASPS